MTLCVELRWCDAMRTVAAISALPLWRDSTPSMPRSLECAWRHAARAVLGSCVLTARGVPDRGQLVLMQACVMPRRAGCGLRAVRVEEGKEKGAHFSFVCLLD